MLISIQKTYRGRVLSSVLVPGEHEVPDRVGRYLLDNFSGPPFFVKQIGKQREHPPEDIETKPTYPQETKPTEPAEPSEPRRRPGRPRGSRKKP